MREGEGVQRIAGKGGIEEGRMEGRRLWMAGEVRAKRHGGREGVEGGESGNVWMEGCNKLKLERSEGSSCVKDG